MYINIYTFYNILQIINLANLHIIDNKVRAITNDACNNIGKRDKYKYTYINILYIKREGTFYTIKIV